MSEHFIRLDDLLTRHVDVQWFEGVAIVQGVCRQLLGRGTSGGEFPAATDIALTMDGAVKVLGTSSTKAVPAAAHLLAGMLSDDVPVRLRLTVTQSTSEDTTTTLREFSEALAYFERPDAQPIVRALVERGMLSPYRPGADGAALEDFLAEEKTEPKKPDAKAEPRKPRNYRRLATIAALAVGVVALGALVAVAARSGRVAAAVSSVKEAILPAPAVAPDEPLEKPAESAARTRAKAPGSSRAARSQVATGTAGRDRVTDSITAAPSTSATLQALPLIAPINSPTPIFEHPSHFARSFTAPGTRSGEPSDAVYSKADMGVTPPRQVYPALPAEPPAAFRRDDLTIVELLIATDGLVERVRLRTPPRDIHEFMLLSAAKAWRFKPATLEGRPVRFLHSVAITSFQ